MCYEQIAKCVDEIENQIMELIDCGAYERANELVSDAINRLLLNKKGLEAEIAAIRSGLH